jgi:hypothetical protein
MSAYIQSFVVRVFGFIRENKSTLPFSDTLNKPSAVSGYVNT